MPIYNQFKSENQLHLYQVKVFIMFGKLINIYLRVWKSGSERIIKNKSLKQKSKKKKKKRTIEQYGRAEKRAAIEMLKCLQANK